MKKELLNLLIKESRQAYLENNLVTEDELTEMINELKKLSKNSEMLIGFPRTTQISATAT